MTAAQLRYQIHIGCGLQGQNSVGSFCPGSGCSSTAGAGAGRGTLLPSTQQTSASQLQLPSSYNGTKCHDIVQIVSMSTYNIQHNPTHGAQPVVGLAAGRAGQRSQSCSSAPRPGPPRPQHGTRHGLSFSLSAPGPPQPGRGAVRVPHSALARPHISCSPLAGHHAVTAGPQQGHHHPLLRVRLQEAWRGRGPAGGSPAATWPPQRWAGRAGAGTGRTQQQPNSSGEGKSSQKHNPHNFCTPDPPQPGQGTFTGGVGEAGLASLSGAGHFLESGAISETLTRQSLSRSRAGVRRADGRDRCCVTSRRHLSGNTTNTNTNTNTHIHNHN